MGGLLGAHLNTPQILKGTRGKAESWALSKTGFLHLLAPQRHLGAEHAPSKWGSPRGPPTQPNSWVPFALSPQPTSPASLLPHVLPLPTLIPSSSSISSSWCSVFHSGVLRALDGMITLWMSANDCSQALSSLLPAPWGGLLGMAPAAPGLSQPRCPRALTRAHRGTMKQGQRSPGYQACSPKASEERDTHMKCPPLSRPAFSSVTSASPS